MRSRLPRRRSNSASRSACKPSPASAHSPQRPWWPPSAMQQDFRNGRQFAAWLGLMPRQHSTGGKTRLGRITRRGDAYLRTLLILGAKSALQAALRKPPERTTSPAAWIVAVFGRIGYHKTLVAIANKHARIIWALLVKGEDFDVQRLAATRDCVTKQQVQPETAREANAITGQTDVCRPRLTCRQQPRPMSECGANGRFPSWPVPASRRRGRI